MTWRRRSTQRSIVRRPLARTVACVLSLGLLSALQGRLEYVRLGSAEPPADVLESPHVVLRDGSVVEGRSVGEEGDGAERRMLFESCWGFLSIPKREIRRVHPGSPDAILRARQVRVLEIRGAGALDPSSGTVTPLVSLNEFAEARTPNTPNSIIRPGMRVRTTTTSELRFQIHRRCTVYMQGDADLEIPMDPSSATFRIWDGSVAFQVEGEEGDPPVVVQVGAARIRAVSALMVLGSHGGFASGIVTRGMFRLGSGASTDYGPITAGRGFQERAGGVMNGGPASASSLSHPELTTRWPRFPVDAMVYVPAGTYRVGGAPVPRGAQAAPPGRYDSTYAGILSVTLEAYWADRREVSNQEYADHHRCTQFGTPPTYFNGVTPPPRLEDSPVHGLPHRSALRFAHWCGKTLPTSEQWEVLALGTEPSKRTFPWGNTWTDAHAALPVGAFVTGRRLVPSDGSGWTPPAALPSTLQRSDDVSPWGAYAMVSGVPEWCRELWPELLSGRLQQPRGIDPSVLATCGVVRGWRGSAHHLGALGVETPGYGCRCVVPARAEQGR